MPGKMLYIGVLGFSLGIVFSSLHVFKAITVCASGILLILLFLTFSFLTRQRRSYYGMLTFFFTCALLGQGRVVLFEHQVAAPLLDKYVGQRVTVHGSIDNEIDLRETSQRFVFETTSFTPEGGAASSLKKMIYVSTALYPRFAYGDELILTGKLLRPQPFETDSGRLFDYQAYLRKDGIAFVMSKPKIEVVSHGKASNIRSLLIQVKSSFIDHLSRVMPEPENALLGGLLVGAKRSLGTELSATFRIVGLIHIVVLSGYNLTIIAQFFMALFSRLNRQVRLILGALSIVAFALMVGLSATVVRASLMAILALTAEFSYRRYDVSRALALTAFLMLLHNPMILTFDPSFQLSFLATIGLIYVSPIVLRFLPRIIRRSVFKEIVVTTLSTQLFVTPYLLYLTGNLSLIALLSNILVLPVIPIAMFSGFLTGLLSFISSVLATPFAGVTYFILSYVLSIIDLLSRVPFASLSVRVFPLWVVVIVYACMISFLFLHAKKENTLGKKIKTT
jgi:competence protein ComEC